MSLPSPSTALTLAPVTSSLSWHQALSHKDGRDRFLRLLQYTLRLLRGTLSGRALPTTYPLAQLFALETSLAASRQAFRLFKWTGFYTSTSLRDLLSIPPRLPSGSALTSSLAALQDFFLALYLALDNHAFLAKSSVVRGDPSAASRRAARAWLVASVLGLVNCLRRWRAARAERRPLRVDARRASAPPARHAALAAKYAGDAVVAWSLVRRGAKGTQPHPALVGACGVVSSLVMFADVWPREPAAAGREAGGLNGTAPRVAREREGGGRGARGQAEREATGAGVAGLAVEKEK